MYDLLTTPELTVLQSMLYDGTTAVNIHVPAGGVTVL